MRLSFSLRGWNHLNAEEVITEARESGLQGLELYNVYEEASELNPASPEGKRRLYRRLKNEGLSVCCIDSAMDIAAPFGELKEKLSCMMDAASDLQCPYIAVDASEEVCSEETLEQLRRMAAASRCIVLIKTKKYYSNTERLRALLDRLACDEIAALWDLHHTVRDGRETPADTIRNLGAYIKHVHVHDSNAMEDSEDRSYELIGEGTLPLGEMMEALSSVDYDAFLSLEWKPEWMADYNRLDVILPHFSNYMEQFEETRGHRKQLYYNYNGTGQYIWKRDELINVTFPQLLDRLVEEFPDQEAFRYTTLDYTRTYEEFRNDVDDLARGLVSLGVRPQSKVAIWAGNIPAWYLAFWAVTKIGAVLVTVNTAYKVHEVEYLLRQSDTHTLIMSEGSKDIDYCAIMQELCPETLQMKAGESLHARKLPFLRNIITCGCSMKGCLRFEEVMNRAGLVSLREIQLMAAEVKPGDVCNMQYTSGTTGFPKGVMLTHYNVVNNGKCIGDRMGLSTADRMMIQVPMFHCFGMVLAMTASMTHGTTLCPLPYFSAKASLSCINSEHITCFHGVPTMFIAMFNHEDYRKTDFSYMRTGIMAGSGCPPELMKRAARPDEMNMRGIVSVYGQTESAPGSTMSAWEDSLKVRTETVGYAFPEVQCKVIDPETGETLPPGVDGEFCSRGYNTMKGYYKMPGETRKAVDAEGWLHSGDLARYDEDGNYYITGRLKDMIIRGGENIYPKEIEEFIYTHPAVSDVQVVGVPDERYGEEAMACVIVQKGKELSEEELRKYMEKSIARHKVPKYIRFVESFPMNAAGKILKYKMREEAAEYLKEHKS